MTEILLAVSAFLVVVIVASIAIGKWFVYRRLKKFEDDVDFMIEEYRSKITGSNRFLMNEELLAKAFPEYSRDDVREVWKRIVARKLVDRDPLDSELCIRK